MKYAILTIDLDAVAEVRDFQVLPPHKPGRLLPIVVDDEPSFNITTHKLAIGSYTVEPAQVRQQWNVVPLNGSELYNLAIDAGYVVDPEGFTLRLQDGDRAQFAQMLALVKEALDLGAIINDTPQTISDTNGVIHTISTLRFRQIMLAYGLHYKGLWDQLATSA